MIVAIDTETKTAVLGPEIDHDANDPESSSGRYRCLLCEEPLSYDSTHDGVSLAYFTHKTDSCECFNDGNVSIYHRLGQEVAVKTIANWVPYSIEDLQIDIEKRVGDRSNFIISDILLSDPINIAVEITYVNRRLCLQRRLTTLFDHGYPVMLIFLTTGQISPSRAEHHLQKISPITVGRFDPDTCELRFGSLIKPDDTDPNEINWDAVPAYLS